jgi:hypothetical protein
MFSTAFPRAGSSTLNAWGIGAFVIEEGSYSGVHSGPYKNIPPTSRPLTIYELNIVQFENGKIANGVTYGNEMDLREQLGLTRSGKPSAPAKPKK